MKIVADFIPPEDLIVTMVNGVVVDPPILLKKGRPVHVSFAAQFPDLNLRAGIELAGYRVRPGGGLTKCQPHCVIYPLYTRV